LHPRCIRICQMTEGRVSSQRYVPQEGSKWIIYGIDLLDESII